MKKKKTNVDGTDRVERFINSFFDGLKKGAADRVVKKTEKQKLPPDAIRNMKEIEELYDEMDDMFDHI